MPCVFFEFRKTTRSVEPGLSFFYCVGKFGEIITKERCESFMYYTRVNHYIGNMTNPVQPFG
jgi:hypothetical protein